MNGDQMSALKQKAAEFAVQFVLPGMRVGLGTGSTAIFATRLIGKKSAEGQLNGVSAIATSEAVDREARSLGLKMIDDDLASPLDITIDGADEVDPQFRLIKGAGGALLREKVVAQASKRVVIVVDETKIVSTLGTSCKVPVEVLRFAWRSQLDYLEGVGALPAVRHASGGEIYLTDSGNIILDCEFGPIRDVDLLKRQLESRAGVVGHGLFVDIATDIVVAKPTGIEHLQRK